MVPTFYSPFLRSAFVDPSTIETIASPIKSSLLKLYLSMTCNVISPLDDL
jgi:hypothetical protein